MEPTDENETNGDGAEQAPVEQAPETTPPPVEDDGAGKEDTPPAAAAPDPTGGRPTFSRPILVPHTPTDKEALAAETFRVLRQIAQHDADRAAFLAENGAKKKEMLARLTELQTSYLTGGNEQMVGCFLRAQPNAPIWDIVRVDTLAVIDQRPMTPEEIQREKNAAAVDQHLAETRALEERQREAAAALAGGGDMDPAHAMGRNGSAASARNGSPRKETAPSCPAPVDGNPEGLCGEPGKKRALGFCPGHAASIPLDERKKIADAVEQVKRALRVAKATGAERARIEADTAAEREKLAGQAAGEA